MGRREVGLLLSELKKPKVPISCFWKVLIPFSRFPRIDKTDLKDCSAPFSQNNSFLIFCENNIFQKGFLIFSDYVE